MCKNVEWLDSLAVCLNSKFDSSKLYDAEKSVIFYYKLHGTSTRVTAYFLYGGTIMQRCRFCGFEFPDNARFCANCGQAPTSNTAFNTASSSFASSTEANTNTIANTSLPQRNQPDEEERSRGAFLPVPLPFGMDGSPAVGQVPMVHGAPSFSGVPYVQGSTPSMAGSVPSSNFAGSPSLAPSNAPSAAQPVSFENQSYSWTNQPAPHSAQPTGPQSHQPREQEYPGKQHHHREHHQHHVHQNTHTTGAVSKSTTGGITKVILICTIGVIVVVVGASTLVFAMRSHLPGLAGIIPFTSSNSNTNSSNHNANTTACSVSPDTPCVGTTFPASGQSTGTFTFTGAVSGVMVITSFPVCAVLQGNSYSLQVIGTVGGTQYKFVIGMLSYKGPGNYTSQLTVDLLRGSGANIGVLVNDGTLPVSISITNGGKAGTVNSDIAGILNGVQLSKGHVSASWTCG